MNRLWLCLLSPLGCAVLLTLANAPKPLVVDDTAYYLFARQIAEHPLDPYGFRFIWYQWPDDAFNILAPPVVPYWLALGVRLFGEHPFLWKLWLFPFCWLLTASLYALFRRFARGFETTLLVITTFSPAILPAVNLMLDVPALAFTLASVAVFLRALDSPSYRWPRVLLAGLLAGLGMQTKYTAFMAPAVMGLYGVLAKRPQWGILAAVVAVLLFAGWERFLISRYGESHFLKQLEYQRATVEKPDLPPDAGFLQRWSAEIAGTVEAKSGLVSPLLGNLGGLAPAVALLALAGLRLPRGVILGLGLLVLAEFLALASVPDQYAVFVRAPDTGNERLTLSSLIFGINGALFVIGVLGGAFYLGFRGWSRWRLRPRLSRYDWFLILWFWGEVLAYFLLTPFAAARRVMELCVVGTLIAGRLVSLTCRAPGRAELVRGVAAFGVGLGVLYGVTDLLDAFPEKQAAEWGANWVRSQPEYAGQTIWFTGHWGFKYYAERAGMRPVLPDESVLRAGDWVVLPDVNLWRPYGQRFRLRPEQLEPLAEAAWRTPLPFRTIWHYYTGASPIGHGEGTCLHLTIYRVLKTGLAENP